MITSKNFKINKKYTISLLDGNTIKGQCITIKDEIVLIASLDGMAAKWFPYSFMKSVK